MFDHIADPATDDDIWDAYFEGFDAAHDGLRADENPHERGSFVYMAWADGHVEGIMALEGYHAVEEAA